MEKDLEATMNEALKEAQECHDAEETVRRNITVKGLLQKNGSTIVLFRALVNGWANEAKGVIEKNPSLLFQPDGEDREEFIQFAADEGYLKQLPEELISKEVLGRKYGNNETLLHIALRENIEQISWKDEYYELLFIESNSGVTPLEVILNSSEEKEKEKIFKKFFKGKIEYLREWINDAQRKGTSQEKTEQNQRIWSKLNIKEEKGIEI